MTELEQKRAVVMKAMDIAAKQLERDALKFEEQAIVGDNTIQRRHELMDHARALRIAGGWLEGLSKFTEEPEPVATAN